MKKKLLALLTALAIFAMITPLTANASSIITATPHTVNDHEWHYNLVKVTHPAVTFQGACFINYSMYNIRPIVTSNSAASDLLGNGEFGQCMSCGLSNTQYYYNSHEWLDDWKKPCGVTHGYHTCGDFGNGNLVQNSVIIAPECVHCGFSGGLITIPAHDVWYCPTCAYDTSAYQSEALHFTEPSSYAYYCHTCNRAIADALADSHEHNLSYAPAHSVTTGTTTDYYYNTTYGYKGNSSTFTVYDITTEDCTVSKVVTPNYTSGLSTTAAIEGATVSLSFSSTVEAVFVWLPGQVAPHISYYTKNGYLPDSSKITSYSFTMPASDIRITTAGPEALLTVSPTIDDNSLTVGQVTQIIPNATEGATISYSSSDVAGLVVNPTGAVTAKKKGSYTITVTGTL